MNRTVKYQGAFSRIAGFAGKRFLFSPPPSPRENIRFSSLFAAGTFRAKRPQRQRERRNGCFRRLPSPSPSPFHLFFCSGSNFRAITRLETLATQATCAHSRPNAENQGNVLHLFLSKVFFNTIFFFFFGSREISSNLFTVVIICLKL